MKKTIFFGIIIVTIMISCVSVKVSELRPVGQIEKLLPPLEAQIDINSLESAYSRGTSNTTGYGSTYSYGQNNGATSIGGYSSQSLAKADKRVQETITLFERDVEENITNPIGKKKGTITCKIASSNTKATKWFWFIPSICSLYTLNVIGMPMFYYKTELELNVDIKDLENNVIAKYKGYGVSEVPVAMYYGYYGQLSGNNNSKDFGASRKTNIDAFKMAMKEIKDKISKDSMTLNNKLN